MQSDWFAGIPAKCDNSLVGMCPGLPLSAVESVARALTSYACEHSPAFLNLYHLAKVKG